jgi:hypothetical protein
MLVAECVKHFTDRGYCTKLMGANTVAMYNMKDEFRSFFN